MKVSAGTDVDIWCTKCKANTVGTVVAMVNGAIAQVTCKICGSGPKKYRPAKGKKAVGAAKPAGRRSRSTSRSSTGRRRTTAPRVASTPMSKEANLALWQTRRDAETREPFRYDVRATYATGDAIKHPKWGLGFVEQVRGEERIEVLFEEGRKLLIMSYSK